MKIYITFRLKYLQIIVKKKGFCSKRVLESSSVRKRTIDIDILIKSRNDRKIIQPVRIAKARVTRMRKYKQFSFTFVISD